jgi:DNA-binding response OmpR family regulator
VDIVGDSTLTDKKAPQRLRDHADQECVTTVLVVDDDTDHRDLLSLALRRAGHEVVTATDAGTAMAALGPGGIDAAVIDIRMPGITGIDLCRRLRAEPGTAVLPIMLISADINDSSILDGLAAGADDFVPKPVRRVELCARLDNLLLRRPAMTNRAANAALLAARHAMPISDSRSTDSPVIGAA